MLNRLVAWVADLVLPKKIPTNDLTTFLLTRDDPHEWMTDAERKYHLDDRMGR